MSSRFFFEILADSLNKDYKRVTRNINCLMPNNMKQIKAHIAVSLDGFIATSDNELDWITLNVKSLIGKEYHHRLTAYHYHFSFHVLSEVEYL